MLIIMDSFKKFLKSLTFSNIRKNIQKRKIENYFKKHQADIDWNNYLSNKRIRAVEQLQQDIITYF